MSVLVELSGFEGWCCETGCEDDWTGPGTLCHCDCSEVEKSERVVFPDLLTGGLSSTCAKGGSNLEFVWRRRKTKKVCLKLNNVDSSWVEVSKCKQVVQCGK